MKKEKVFPFRSIELYKLSSVYIYASLFYKPNAPANPLKYWGF